MPHPIRRHPPNLAGMLDRRQVRAEPVVTERGDKVIPLGQRLDTIEVAIASLEARVNRIFVLLAGLIGIANAPGLLEQLNKLVGH